MYQIVIEKKMHLVHRVARASGKKLYENGAHCQLTMSMVDGKLLLREVLLLNNSKLETYLPAS